jgi:hypothetical protein
MKAGTLTIASLAAIFPWLLLPLPISAQSGQAQADTSKPLIEIRFARRTPAEDFRHITDPPRSRIVFPNDSFYVSNKNVFTDSSFTDVVAELGAPNEFMLHFAWKPDAAERLAQIIKGQFDAGIDQLAVFVDGELVTSSVIVVNLNWQLAKSLSLSMPAVPRERAMQMQMAVAKRWPRRE